MLEFWKGLGLGVSILIGTLAVFWYKKIEANSKKARAFDLEIKEKEIHNEIENKTIDDLISDANKSNINKPDK